MNVNSLDARAFSARGCLGDGLAEVLRSISGGLIHAQDRADARADRAAERDVRYQERQQDQQRQDAERTWQHDRYDRQDARAGMTEALRRAAEYGIVPPRDEFVTRPSVDEQATWAAAQAGADKRGLHEALTRAQIALASDRGAAAAARATGAGGAKLERPTAATLKAAHELAQAEAHRRGALTFDEVTGKQKVNDPTTWNTILRESYKLHGIDVPEGWRDSPSPAGAPAAPEAKRGMVDRLLDRYVPGSGQPALPAAEGPPPSDALLADLRGMPSMPGSSPANAAATASTLSPAEIAPAAPPVDPRQMAVQTIQNEREVLANMGLDAGVFLTPDLNEPVGSALQYAARRRVLAAMPLDARRRVIDALRVLNPSTGR